MRHHELHIAEGSPGAREEAVQKAPQLRQYEPVKLRPTHVKVIQLSMIRVRLRRRGQVFDLQVGIGFEFDLAVRLELEARVIAERFGDFVVGIHGAADEGAVAALRDSGDFFAEGFMLFRGGAFRRIHLVFVHQVLQHRHIRGGEGDEDARGVTLEALQHRHAAGRVFLVIRHA